MDSILLVFTDSQGIAHLDATNHWKPLALRTKQATATQILFMSRDTWTIERVAILNEETPFDAIKLDESQPTLYMPNVAVVIEMFEEISVDPDVVYATEALKGDDILLKHHEAATVTDVDDLICGQMDLTEYIVGEITEQAVLNTRDINQQLAVRYLQSAGLAKISIDEEFHAEVGLRREESLKNLPDNFSHIEDADGSLLYLLNSAFVTA